MCLIYCYDSEEQRIISQGRILHIIRPFVFYDHLNGEVEV